MQINRNLTEALDTLADASAANHFKGIIRANIQNTAIQSRANWTASNRIDGLIEVVETLQNAVEANGKYVNRVLANSKIEKPQ